METFYSIYPWEYLASWILVTIVTAIISWIRWPYLKQFPRWWRFRVWYRTQVICKHPVVAGGFPSIVVLIAFVYEFHSGLPFIGNWLTPHEEVIGLLALVCLPILILTSIVGATSESGNAGYVRRLTAYLVMASDVVTAKSDRLIDTVVPNAVNGANREDCFVDPIEQIRSIFNHATRFLQNEYNLDRDQIDITVVGRDMPGGKWAYLYKHQTNWEHTDAEVLMSKRACVGRKCLKSSKPVFFPNKKTAAIKKKLSPERTRQRL